MSFPYGKFSIDISNFLFLCYVSSYNYSFEHPICERFEEIKKKKLLTQNSRNIPPLKIYFSGQATTSINLPVNASCPLKGHTYLNKPASCRLYILKQTGHTYLNKPAS